jgi:putative peptide zinc metalloprotease protein
MNLSQALDQPSAEFPRDDAERYPTFNPKTIMREHLEPQGKVIMAMAPGTGKVVYLTPTQWAAVQLFDGRRSYEDVSRLVRKKLGISFSAEALRKFCDDLENFRFWYKSPQEESIALMHKLVEGRKKRTKPRKASDLYKIEVMVWDPDRFFTKFHNWVEWAYTPWFTALSIIGFLAMLGIWATHWDEIWRDTLQYYNFTEKTFRDLLEFYVLFAIMAFFHESGHALTAKHFGAEVHRMGFMLIYTSPAVFVDSSEVWLYRGRRERCITILGGLWVEVLLYGVIGTFIWWGTPAGGTAHDLAYKCILTGAILPVLVNLNPLVRLDGYLCFCELIRTPGLKQRSTAFLSAWIKKHIFHLPATVPYLPRRRAWFFAIFGILSGFYSYVMMLFFARIAYRIVLNFSPDWAWLAGTLVALNIFKSRIITLGQFLRTLYLDKRELMLAHRNALYAAAAVVLVLLLLPLRHESAEMRFVLEPAQRAVVHAAVPGQVVEVAVDEGQRVRSGELLARLRDLKLESKSAEANAAYQMASAKAVQAELRYAGYGAAKQEQEHQAEILRSLAERREHLDITSPIAGVVVTHHVRDLQGTYIAEGTQVAEIQDISTLRARTYVPESDMRILGELTGNSLRVDSQVGSLRGRLVTIGATAETLPEGLTPTIKYKGIKPPPFWVAVFEVENPGGRLHGGESGTAKIYGRRRSILGSAIQVAADLVGRKIW